MLDRNSCPITASTRLTEKASAPYGSGLLGEWAAQRKQRERLAEQRYAILHNPAIDFYFQRAVFDQGEEVQRRQAIAERRAEVRLLGLSDLAHKAEDALVADPVAERVVYFLEVVDVKKLQRQRCLVAACQLQCITGAFFHQHAVWQAGQRVVVGQSPDAAFSDLAFGDVAEARNVMGGVARSIAETTQGEPLRVVAAVLAAFRGFAL